MKVLHKIQNSPKIISRFTGKLVAFARKKRTVYFSLSGVAILLFSIFFYNFAPFFNQLNYELSPKALELVGEVRDDAEGNLKLNESQNAFEFALLDSGNSGSLDHTGRVVDAYSAKFSTSPKEGISVTDKNTNVTISMIPKFVSAEGKITSGQQVVYPFGKNQLVYSLKYNGLKEDIIVPEFDKDQLNHKFDLILPVGAEARLDSNGNMGIYTADNSLFGQMSYGSDSDRELVEKAREKSEKNNLIATIPAPIIKEANAKEHTDKAVFKLGEKTTEEQEAKSKVPDEIKDKVSSSMTINKYELSIESQDLENLNYPISIDPTFQIASASNFADVSMDAGVEIDTDNGTIRRSQTSGGTVGSWTSAGSLHEARIYSSTIVYNGFIYLLGGQNYLSWVDTVHYAPINPNGTIGSWTATTSIPGGDRIQHQAEVYNGYIYLVGGRTGSNDYTGDVYYSKINQNGTLGTWQSTASLLTTRREFSMATNNGYLYVSGGLRSGAANNEVQYARLNANGSVASDSGCGTAWCATTGFTENRMNHSLLAYNGWLYVIGGRGASGVVRETAYYAPINSDGSVGSWIEMSSPGTARHYSNALISNGYVYVIGGCTDYTGGVGCDSLLSSVEYAPIYADGSLGAWRITNALTTASDSSDSISWNGRIYIIGGCVSYYGAAQCNLTDRIEYTSIESAGSLEQGSWTSATSLPAAYSFGVSVAYDGYLYHVGGWSGALGYLGTVRYASINADGSLGSWTTSGNTLSTPRRSHAVTIYGGKLYVAGGYNGSSSLSSIEYTTIGASGSVGSFATTTSSMPAAQSSPGFEIYNGIAYIVGGFDSVSSDVQRAVVSSSTGNITGSWTTSSIATGNKGGGKLIISGGYMYVVGGGASDCTSTLRTAIDYVSINSDGSLGTWTTGTSYVSPRCNHSAFMYNGYFYMVGGHNGSVALGIEKAPVLADGSVGSWQVAGDLDQARGHPSNNNIFGGGAVYSGYVYLVGGHNGSSHLSSVVYKVINNGGNGASEAFTATTGVGNNRKNAASVAYDGHIYVFGGCTNIACTNATNNSRYAAINDDGTVGTWGLTGFQFSGARYNLYAWAFERKLCIAGGFDGSGTQLTDIRCATLSNGGDPGNTVVAWATDDTSLPSTGVGSSYTTFNDTLYILGGASSPTTTYYASYNTSTGDVSAFSTTTSLPEARYNGWGVAYNGYIYAIGGYNGSSYLRSVDYAVINSNGTIGTWKKATAELNAAISNAVRTSSFTSNGYIYIVGGENSSGFYNRLQFAAASSSGDLGKWQTGVASGLTDHGNYTAVIGEGNAIITSGQYSGNNTSGIVRYASLAVVPRIGSFSKQYDFEVGVKVGNLITRGNKQAGGVVKFNKVQNADCGTDWFNPIDVSNLSFGSNNKVDLYTAFGNTLVQCHKISYVLDDKKAAVFPDYGNQTTITDFDLHYTSNPGTRLRGGRTFTNGQDRGLEISP